VSDWNQTIIDEFRANGGKVNGPFEGATLVLLHTTGARSGQERVNPLMARLDGEEIIVFASKAGAPTNPDWYHNLLANPHARVELGTETIDVVARIAQGDERDRLWERNKQENPGFADYEAATTRTIPVVVLDRA
jgi:deazaflavin-dependent oxidoreductase (nitroreductase family)